MTINALSLPVDIPWRRRCVSKDMNDAVICDGRFPLKWRSSIAIFTYEPPEPEQTLPDDLITYVKVSCTITGHQRNAKADLALPGQVTGFSSGDVTNAFETAVSQYHACYGALLQVSVGAPRGASFFAGRGRSPYIADFEPKKRELYELVTETGETMSRTLEAVNVGKSNVSSRSSEVVDGSAISLQMTQSAGDKQAQQTETTQSAQFEATNQKTNVGSSQIEDSRSSDLSRESRETNSHTTQLTQMYHQLTGYHVGTNRALFFMLPRPHIVQSPQTFVKGPRQLEGIQEFFLVVVRPKGWDDFCIEAYLETAHLTEPQTEPVRRTVYWPTKKVVAGIETASDTDGALSFGDDSHDGPEIADVDSYPVPPGCTIESATEIDRDTQMGTVSVLQNDPTGLVVKLSAHAHFTDDQSLFGGGNHSDPGWAQATYEIVLLTPEVRQTDAPRQLFLTGRSLCCCDEGLAGDLREHISYEAVLKDTAYRPTKFVDRLGRPALNPERRFHPQGEGVTILEANTLRDRIGQEMAASVSSLRRHPPGVLGLEESEYMAGVVARSLRRGDDTDVLELPGLSRALRSKLRGPAAGLRRSDLLAMSPQEQQARFGVSDEELVDLRRVAIGLVPSDEEPEAVWNRRRFGGATVPDVLNLDLEAARIRFQRAGLSAPNVTYVDSHACRGTVLRQSPPAGPRRLGEAAPALEVASGSCVLMPDLAGLALGDALLRLRDAGYLGRPKLAPANARVDASVTAARPKAGAWITPEADVMLTLG